MPEQSCDQSDDHSKSGQVESEGRADRYREWYMQVRTDGAIENEWNHVNQATEDDAVNSFSPGQPDCNDGRRSLPSLSIDGIRHPKAENGQGCPGTSFNRCDISIDIAPCVCVGKSCCLLRNHPTSDVGLSLNCNFRTLKSLLEDARHMDQSFLRKMRWCKLIHMMIRPWIHLYVISPVSIVHCVIQGHGQIISGEQGWIR